MTGNADRGPGRHGRGRRPDGAHGLSGASNATWLNELLEQLPPPAFLPARFDPQRLSAESAARLEGILADELAENTRRTYQQALRLWCLWYLARYGVPLPLPVPVPAVQQFVIDFAEHRFGADWSFALPPAIDALLVEVGAKSKCGPWSLNTVMTRVAALGAAHRWKELASPTEDPSIVRLLRALRRQYNDAGIVESRATALTIEDVQRMLAACDDGLRGIRDRALIAFAFATGGRRRAEVAGARLEALERRPDGSFLYELRRSKTQRSGERRAEDWKPVAGRAAEYLALWLDVSGVAEGPIFRRITKGQAAAPLSESAVREIVIKRAREAGIEGNITAHSIRAGFVTEAIRMKHSLLDIMSLTGHRSVQTVKKYHRPDTLADASAAKLLD
jgi:integrase